MRLVSGRTLLLLVAAVVAAFTAISVKNRLSQAPVSEQQQAVVQTTRVVIARHDIAPGTFVQGAQDLDWGTITEDAGNNPPVATDNNGSPSDNNAVHENGSHEMYLHEGAVKLADF